MWFGLNRTGHPDWGKIFGDSNGQIKLRAKQKFKFLSATYSSNSRFDWLTRQKVVKENEMICDWLANRECLFPEESSVKANAFRVR